MEAVVIADNNDFFLHQEQRPAKNKSTFRGVYRRGDIYWICYAGVNGETIRESSQSRDVKVAENLVRIKKEMIKRIKFDRPKCPECGSSIVQSRGGEWSCTDCGRRWVKNLRRKPLTSNVFTARTRS
jgi:ribosomal protein L37AE/L43A